MLDSVHSKLERVLMPSALEFDRKQMTADALRVDLH
jgi:hypothetical protein